MRKEQYRGREESGGVPEGSLSGRRPWAVPSGVGGLHLCVPGTVSLDVMFFPATRKMSTWRRATKYMT